MTNILDSQNMAPATITSSASIFNGEMISQLTAFAKLMAHARVSVPEHLIGNPADCLAITMQALQWGMSPYQVAQKTYIVGGKIGYEAQLINAVISSSDSITGRFKYEYGGDWSRCATSKEVTVKRKGRNGGEYTAQERVRGWSDADEMGLFVRVGAVLRGETEITWGEEVYLSSVVIRNSPLWVSNPKQQIAYLALKYWARLYTPDVILGVYTKEELEEPQEKIINPIPDHVDIRTFDQHKEGETYENETDASANQTAWVDTFRTRIDDAGNIDETTALRKEVESQKSAIGISLYTELKGRVVQRHHHLTAMNRIAKMIIDLPKPDEPEAAARFTALENALNAAKVHLGELYDKYRVTLDDMKPEYIGA